MTTEENKNDTPYTLTIGWLYPDLMGIYGDRGNIICLSKRSEARGINVVVKNISLDTPPEELGTVDLIFMGGAQDSQQKTVMADLQKEKGKKLGEMIESGVPGLYICGAYQLLGKYYKEADGTTIEGLGIFDIHTVNPGAGHNRLIGNVVARINPKPFLGLFNPNSLVGFENHGGRTYLGANLQPLARVVKGFGNNGEDRTEGVVYKNSLGSYFHGPILPKNPQIADFLIEQALEKKYGWHVKLTKLDDTLSYKAHNAML